MNRAKRAFPFLCMCATLFLLAARSLHAETRVALVVGNGAYQNAPRLPNPANAAAHDSAALQRDGLQKTLATYVGKSKMEEATIRFAKAAPTPTCALSF